MSSIKLHKQFSPPAFLRVIRVTPCSAETDQSPGRRPPAARTTSRQLSAADPALPLADPEFFHAKLVPALRGAKAMSIVSSFLFAREHLVDAIDAAWENNLARTYWMTSDVRLRQAYAHGADNTRSTQDRDLIADFSEMLDSAVLRFGPYHAKYALVDPLESSAKGWLMSCNLIEQACAENLEVQIELDLDECRQLYQLARHVFWEKAATELCEDNQQRAASSPFPAPLPKPKGNLVWTVEKESNLIREHALRLINEATASIDICGHSWSPDHPVLEALAKKARDGVAVRLLGWRFGDGDRQPPIHRSLGKLIEAGVEVYEVPKLHAKYLLTDKAGMMCTANFARKGLDEGIEVGLLLNKERLAQARLAFEHFRSKAETHSRLVNAIDPAESVEGDIMVYRPEFPDSPIETQGTHTLEPKVITATCATTVKEEAQEALRSHLEALANPKDRLAAWTTQKGGNPKTPRTLNQTITAVVEVKPPTVPSKHRMPDSDPTTPQIIEHKGREWVVIPDPGKDHVLLAQAAALAREHGCNVAFWD